SWIAHVGTRSFTVSSELLDGDAVLARASVVMVTFDKETQRSRPMADSQRERLEQELSAG
ncbi:MAG: acyl-CoA thioesterase YbgC, partial [Marmoricola sp.]|nr:acyl-CoA thioesterase YbgC [Marmoricola sp.]